MNARLAGLSLAALLCSWPAASYATAFRLPLNGCDQPAQCMDTNKCYVTAYYDQGGKDWNCGTEMYDGHAGSDFGVQGQVNVRSVVAGAAGTVIETNDGCGAGAWGSTCGGGFGNYVKLQHADGKTTIYGHFYAGSLRVKTGDTVTCGQELGRAGTSGNSTGPHLHFEVIDPTYGSDDPYAGTCGGPLTYWVSQGAYCRLPATTCESACTKQCTGKDCGPDGCGGQCGTCSSGMSCGQDGKCAANSLDKATFESETVPDGTSYNPGEKFVKTWTMKNEGLTTWTKAAGYSFAFQEQEQFSAQARTWPLDTETTPPGALKTWSVLMTAPMVPGNYTGFWRTDRNGALFGDKVWAAINVKDPPAGVDGATFVSETIPDDTHFMGGTSFTKTWTIRNTGTSTWSKGSGYQWKFFSGDRLGAPAITYDLNDGEVVAPNMDRVFSVPMTAPMTAGTYRGYWGLTHLDSSFAGQVWVEIIVNPTLPTDKDGDGHPPSTSGGDDCNDNDPEVFPGNTEKCDGKDNDCNNATDEGLTKECYAPCKGSQECKNGAWTKCNSPLPENEDCNGMDDNCNGFTDDYADCPSGYRCVAGRCVVINTDRPDASSPRPDAAAPGPDAGDAGSGIGKKFEGGCGCSPSSALAPLVWVAALAGAAGLLRRRRR
ncbi:MAG: NBR1-Ig-like domain-containing protein [Myxococcales bacterium]